MPLTIVHENITHMRCEAIVVPTDPCYSGSGGVDLAVHTAAGPALAEACGKLPLLQPGEAVVTDGFGLHCRLIHTVGPIWQGGEYGEEELLAACYRNALQCARREALKSIAFPLIASGTFGFPRDKVLYIAQREISRHLSRVEPEPEVYLCIFDREAYTLRDQEGLHRFLQKSLRPRPLYERTSRKTCAEPGEYLTEACMAMPEAAEVPCAKAASKASASLADWLKHQDDTFAVTLLKLIDKKHMTDVECYKKANVNKNTFWKINNKPEYRPSKQTVLAFAIALELSLKETEALLKTAGFSLSHSSMADMIIEYYIRKGRYDIYEINAALYQYDQQPLGCLA